MESQHNQTSNSTYLDFEPHDLTAEQSRCLVFCSISSMQKSLVIFNPWLFHDIFQEKEETTAVSLDPSASEEVSSELEQMLQTRGGLC